MLYIIFGFLISLMMLLTIVMTIQQAIRLYWSASDFVAISIALFFISFSVFAYYDLKNNYTSNEIIYQKNINIDTKAFKRYKFEKDLGYPFLFQSSLNLR